MRVLPLQPYDQPQRRYQSSRAGRRPTLAEVQDALQTLGVTLQMDAKEWKRRYRALAKEHHPDAGGDPAVMTRITVAYETLTQLSKREREEFADLLRYSTATSDGNASASSYAAARGRHPRSSGSPNYRYAYATGTNASGSSSSTYYRTPADDDSTSGGEEAYQQQRNRKEAFWSYYARRTPMGNRRTTTGAWSGSSFSSSTRDHYSSYPNPFGGPGAFYFGMRPHQRARFMASRALIMRGLAMYFLFLAVAMLVYRFLRDKHHEYEWKTSERMMRNERLQEVHQFPQTARGGAVITADEKELFAKLDQRALWRVMRWKEEQRQMAAQLGWPAVPEHYGTVRQYQPSSSSIAQHKSSEGIVFSSELAMASSSTSSSQSQPNHAVAGVMVFEPLHPRHHLWTDRADGPETRRGTGTTGAKKPPGVTPAVPHSPSTAGELSTLTQISITLEDEDDYPTPAGSISNGHHHRRSNDAPAGAESVWSRVRVGGGGGLASAAVPSAKPHSAGDDINHEDPLTSRAYPAGASHEKSFIQNIFGLSPTSAPSSSPAAS